MLRPPSPTTTTTMTLKFDTEHVPWVETCGCDSRPGWSPRSLAFKLCHFVRSPAVTFLQQMLAPHEPKTNDFKIDERSALLEYPEHDTIYIDVLVDATDPAAQALAAAAAPQAHALAIGSRTETQPLHTAS